MKHANLIRKAVSGMLTALTLLSSVASPISAMALEAPEGKSLSEYVSALPELDAVRDQLALDEIVSAEPYAVTQGAEIDLKTDFTNITYDGEKVKVSFYEAHDEDGGDFTTDHADTYKASYYAEPVSGNPAYRFYRTVTVQEPVVEIEQEAETSGQTEEPADSGGGDEDSGGDDADPAPSETEPPSTENTEVPVLVTEEPVPTEEPYPILSSVEDNIPEEEAAATESEELLVEPLPDVLTAESEETETVTEETASIIEETPGWATGETISGILIWATEKEGIDLTAMDEGETMEFRAPMLRASAPTGYQTVYITKGPTYNYGDYGFGDYRTSEYYISYGNVTATAYCIQPALPGPGSDAYYISDVGGNSALAKVIYYGGTESGSTNFFNIYHPDFPTGKRFILTHMAAAYAYGSSDAFILSTEYAQSLALELYNYAVNAPNFPSAAMSFSNSNVTAYKDGDGQRTENTTFYADPAQTITMNLPDGVVFHNVSTGGVSEAGADVLISGGTVFYLSAPLTQVRDVGAEWSTTMRGSIDREYSAYTITTNNAVQDLSFVFGSGLGNEANVSFYVNWLALATIQITKADQTTGKNLAGAVFGVYSDEACTNLITTMPETDANGSSSVEIVVTQDTVYLKEITAPKGYLYSATAHNVKVVAGESSSLTVPNQEIMGEIAVYKEGEVLTGADVTDSGVAFWYENARLSGAVYQVTAAEDIIAADGTLIYKSGAVVADGLTTDEKGTAFLENLHLGSYTVTEITAPAGFVNQGESKKITLTESDPTQKIVLSETTFTNDRQRVSVSAVKQDKLTSSVLPSAKYGLYADQDILSVDGSVIVKKDTLITSALTDENGNAAFRTDLPLNTAFYVKEIAAPTGFKLNSSEVYRFTTSYTSEREAEISFSHTFENEEVRGELTIYKNGEVLTGVTNTDTGVSFQYETRKQAGAVFNVYAGEDICSSEGKLIYKKGELISENLTTGEDGSVTLGNLFLGTYLVKEIGAPENFVSTGEEKTVTLSLQNVSGEMAFNSVSFTNDRQKVSVTIAKVDDTTKNPLAGGIYGLLTAEKIQNADGAEILPANTLIEEITTGEDGSAVFKADLPLNIHYYIIELQAPEMYVLNKSARYDFQTTYTNDQEPVISFSYTFENERVNARIDLTKQDAETGAKPQGDASLEGAVYGLYARENIVHPDGKTGVVYKKDTQVATLTTDQSGRAFVENLYLGRYYLKELVPSEGYLLDETEYDLDCSYEGDLVETVKREALSKEEVIKQPFQIIKAANNGKTDADLLKGAGFSAWLISTLTVKEDGSYDFDSAQPVVISDLYRTEVFTDERGYAQTIALPYGKYIVRETTTPHNFTPVDDFTVTISENHPTEPQVWRVLLDEEFAAKLKIVKKDDETHKPVLGRNTEFKVYDLDHQTYVEQVTTYPETYTHKSYFTDENGYLILPNNLLPGHYRIEEVLAPDGYTLNGESVEVLVDCNTAFQMDSLSGDAVITVELEDHPVKGKLTIHKQGEVLTGYGKDFKYEVQPLAGAEFAVYAAENIYTPDHQLGADGNRVILYGKDTLVTTVVSDANGEVTVENLPLGSYYVVETKAPAGYVLNEQTKLVTFIYQNQNTPVIEQSVTFDDERQQVSLSVVKQDAETGNKVLGAVFGLYAKTDILAGDKVIVSADTLIEEMTSDELGMAICQKDLPLGNYYVMELKAPAGFVSSDEVLDFDASYQGQDVLVVTLEAIKKNEPTKVEITKSDITTGAELDGATLMVLDKNGNVVDTWTSVRNEPHIIKYLVAGESYVLREDFAPYGYLKAEEVSFTVTDTAEIQKVEMKDEVPTALLIVNKKGEFLDKISVVDHAKGVVEHLFEYVTGSLTEVTFEVYAAEDIKAADGVSADYVKKDALIGTITTDNHGVAKLGDLPVGKYYIKEVATAHGYVLDGEPRYVDLSYRDQDTPVVVYDEGWQNNRQKVQINVLKVEKGINTPLAGGVFALYTAEDIKSAEGKVLMKKDTVIEMKTTDAEGKIRFSADLPVDGSYYVQELYAPAGYATTHEKQAFTVNYGDAAQAEIVYNLRFENEPTTVELRKTDITSSEEVAGAHLEVRDSSGKLIDEWISGKEPHVIRKLEVEQEYTLIETRPADGYVTAEQVKFTVENTAAIQKVEMKDDVTKLRICKVDITTNKELPGAVLTILDKDGKIVETWTSTEEPYYIERLPIGDYTLREETAPAGYLKAEEIKFSIADTGEIQTVTMKDDFTKVQISKQDITTGKELPGAKLTILDKDGKEVESWASTKETHYIEHLPAGEYTLREVSAPDGYEKAEDVKFTVKETGEIQKVVMKDARTPGDTPKTGDEKKPFIWIGLTALGAGMFVGSIFIGKKNENKRR